MPNRDLTTLLLLTVLSCACGGSSTLSPSTAEAHPRTVDTSEGWTASGRQPGVACTVTLSHLGNAEALDIAVGTAVGCLDETGRVEPRVRWRVIFPEFPHPAEFHNDPFERLEDIPTNPLPAGSLSRFFKIRPQLAHLGPICVQARSAGGDVRAYIALNGMPQGDCGPTGRGGPDGSGCPIIIGLGAKGYELPHPGQWLRASYTMSICGPDEWSNQWTVTPQPALMDICENSTALAAKQCGHAVGKFLWIGTPGVYDVTATAPGGVGSTTLYGVVVD